MQALVQSCRNRGVEFILGKNVLEVECNSHSVTGLILENDRLAAARGGHTAGAWASRIRVPGLGARPIRPVKGHIVALESAEERSSTWFDATAFTWSPAGAEESLWAAHGRSWFDKHSRGPALPSTAGRARIMPEIGAKRGGGGVDRIAPRRAGRIAAARTDCG